LTVLARNGTISRIILHHRLEDSPRLKSELETIYAKAYPVAIKSVSKLFLLPKDASISWEQALDEDWFFEDQSGDSEV
jgi:hypothetical protein